MKKAVGRRGRRGGKEENKVGTHLPGGEERVVGVDARPAGRSRSGRLIDEHVSSWSAGGRRRRRGASVDRRIAKQLERDGLRAILGRRLLTLLQSPLVLLTAP